MAEVAVREVGQERDVRGHHDLLVRAHDLEIGEAEHVADLFRRQPGLRRLPVLEAEELGQAQHRLPQPAVAVDHDPRARVAQRVERLQRALHVRQVGDDVDEQHDVEGTFHAREELRVARVAPHELEGPGSERLARGGHGGKGEVDPDSARGTQRGRGNFGHRRPFGHSSGTLLENSVQSRAGAVRRLNVEILIADHNRVLEIDIEILLRS